MSAEFEREPMGFPNDFWTNQTPYKAAGEVIRKTMALIEKKFDSREPFNIEPGEQDFLRCGNLSRVSDKILKRLASRQGRDSVIPHSENPGEVILVTGPPAQLSVVICEVILDWLWNGNDEMVAFHSLKWKVETVVLKLIALGGGINGERLLNGNISEKNWSNTVCSVGLLTEAQLFLAGPPALGLDEIIIQTLLFKKRKPDLKLLVIDSLQFLPREKSESISASVKRIRFLSEDLDLPILVTLADYRGETEVF